MDSHTLTSSELMALKRRANVAHNEASEAKNTEDVAILYELCNGIFRLGQLMKVVENGPNPWRQIDIRELFMREAKAAAESVEQSPDCYRNALIAYLNKEGTEEGTAVFEAVREQLNPQAVDALFDKVEVALAKHEALRKQIREQLSGELREFYEASSEPERAELRELFTELRDAEVAAPIVQNARA